MIKKTSLLLISFCNVIPGFAQTSGVIRYEEKVKLEIHVDDGNEAMLNDIPKEHASMHVLYFNPDATLYQAEAGGKSGKDIEKESEDGGRMVIKMQQPDEHVYCDLKNGKLTEQRDFMSRKFLVESEISSMQWKLTGNQKVILNYPCQEAILQDTARKVVAWFTPAIPLSSGPNGYANLPGMILSLDVANGKRIINAVAVEMKPADPSLFVKPKEGKKMTKEAFNKTVAEKQKEMQEQDGGGANVIIKVRN